MANGAQNAISRGFLRELFDAPGVPVTEGKTPVFQVCAVTPMAKDTSRYRLALSDIDNYLQGMLTSQCNHVAADITVGCLVRLTQFTANFVKANNASKGKRVFVIVGLEVLQEYGTPGKIGNPIQLEPEGETAPTPMSGNDFYGAGSSRQVKEEASNGSFTQAQRSIPSRSAPSTVHGTIYPIEGLSPYANKWTIKVRVTSKSEIKQWHNKNGQGQLFSVNLLDETGEIKATAFKDQVDQFYNLLEEGSVYYISSPCRVQMAKKQFSNLNNDYELSLERDTVIEKAEATDGVPQVRYNFTNLADVANVEKDAVIDAIGVLREIHDVSEIVSKTTNRPFEKRELKLVDNTNIEIGLTLWGSLAKTFDVQPESILAFKGLKVSDFDGRSLSLLSSGTMSVNPEIDEAYRLKAWYDAAGKGSDFGNHNALRTSANVGEGGRRNAVKTIAEIKEENLGMSDEDQWFTIKATIVFIKDETVCYPACPSPPEVKCSRKVHLEDDGTWRCENCRKSWPKPQYRYIMNINVADHTGQLWLSCFDEVGKTIVGTTADEITNIRNSDQPHLDRQIFADANWTEYVFRGRAKLDTYKDEQRVRYQVTGVTLPDHKSQAKRLMDLIKQYD